MILNSISIFPRDFLQKLMNFPKETLINIFNLCEESSLLFLNKKLHHLDPLVCENSCHVRALYLWLIDNKYRQKEKIYYWQSFLEQLNKIIQKIRSLPPNNIQVNKTIEHYIQENHLYAELDGNFLFDIKFVFLCHILTLTKKQFPSSTLALHEKTCLEQLHFLGLTNNKIKCLVSSAQKELSAMSCQFIQNQSKIFYSQWFAQILITRFDDHGRSYLPQYSTAKVIIQSIFKYNVPIILKISRYIKHEYHDKIILRYKLTDDKQDFYYTTHLNGSSQTAIIFEGVTVYSKKIESISKYIDRLNQHSLKHLLLANFAAHPQFSGNLRQTPCIYNEALNNLTELKSPLTNEWEEFDQFSCFAKKQGCTLQNPSLLFLIHVFCDAIVNYTLNDFQENTLQSANVIEL